MTYPFFIRAASVIILIGMLSLLRPLRPVATVDGYYGFLLLSEGARGQSATGAATEKDRTRADALSRMLLGPVAEQLGSKRLLIVSDGILQYVSFGALPVPTAPAPHPGEVEAGGHSGKVKAPVHPVTATSPYSRMAFMPLVGAHELVMLPSASALAVLRREIAGRPPAPKTVAGAVLLGGVCFAGRVEINLVDRRKLRIFITLLVNSAPSFSAACETPNMLIVLPLFNRSQWLERLHGK